MFWSGDWSALCLLLNCLVALLLEGLSVEIPRRSHWGISYIDLPSSSEISGFTLLRRVSVPTGDIRSAENLLVSTHGELLSLDATSLRVMKRVRLKFDKNEESTQRILLEVVPGYEDMVVLCISRCWLVNLTSEVTEVTLSNENSLNHIGGENTPFYILFGSMTSSMGMTSSSALASSITATSAEGVALFVATTFDENAAQIKKNSQTSIASLSLKWNGPKPVVDYRWMVRNNVSALNFNLDYKYNFKVDYVFAFEDSGFVYFLTVQRENLFQSNYETRLVRFCKDDPLFNSYTEIALSCKKEFHRSWPPMASIHYNVARSAYVLDRAAPGTLNRSGGGKTLYVIFSRSDGKDSGYGSGLCGYNMSSIRTEFIKAQKACYGGNGKILQWIDTDKKCQTNVMTATKIDDSDSFCGTPLNRGIGSRYPLDESAIFYTDQFTVTSLVVTATADKTLAVLITNTGSVMKVQLNGDSSGSIHGLKDLTIGMKSFNIPSSTISHPRIILDSTGQNALVLTGSRVSRYQLFSCGIYEDCSSCLQSYDPLECGWCQDQGQCTTRPQCYKTWANNTCPPVMVSFEPKSGPTDAGTLMKIRGSNFGDPDMGSASVEVVGVNCPIESRNNTYITCLTGSIGSPKTGEITISVKDFHLRSDKYNNEGFITSMHQTFSYLVPVLTSFQPNLGMRSGGTLITLFGQNLDIGSRHNVTVAGKTCVITSLSSSLVTCLTSSLPSRSEVPTKGSVILAIDSAELRHGDSYLYVDDPIVRKISPQASFISGGVLLTLQGNNLHGIQHPTLSARLDSNANNSVSMNCTSNSVGTWLTCPSPNVTALVLNSSLPQTFHISLNSALNSVQNFSDLPLNLSQLLYHPDPDVYPFSESILVVDEKTIVLKIKGERLNSAVTSREYVITTGRDVCRNVTVEEETITCYMPDRDMDTTCTHQCPVVIGVGSLLFNVGNIRRVSSSVSKFWTPFRTELILLVGIILTFILTVVCIGSLLWKKCQHRRSFKKAFNAVPNVLYTPGGGSIQQSNVQAATLLTRNAYCLESDANQPLAYVHEDVDVYNLLQDSHLLIPRDKLMLCDVIGQGNFGCVYRGYLMNGTKGEKEVAVKTLKSLTDCLYGSTSRAESQKFIEEAMVMSEFNHRHILQLIGIALDERKRQPMVVLPFMKHGDLLTYIRDERNSPTVKDLMSFAIQIADGMTYLSSLKFVHRDLAARNCMLDDSMQVKVADFGLSRDVYERDYYSSDDRKAKLPVKWMALESLEKGLYSSKSDVWSFGVVVWELLTRGVCPYPEVDSWDIIRYLRSGRRLLQPSYCPEALYRLALECWHPDPNQRPSFDELALDIRDLIESLESSQRRCGPIGLDVTYTHSDHVHDDYLVPQPSLSKL